MKVIKSGDVIIGRCGIHAGVESFGKELFVGDIVQFWRVENDNVDWSSPSLSVIAECDSSTNLGVKPFVFGLYQVSHLMPWDLDCDHDNFTGDENLPINGWIVKKAKHHGDCLVGEKWDSFGFNYADADL